MADVEKLFKGNTAKMGDHMGNFFEAWKFGKWPISDVESQHRSVSLPPGQPLDSARRKLTWDAAKEQFVGDSEADGMLKREHASLTRSRRRYRAARPNCSYHAPRSGTSRCGVFFVTPYVEQSGCRIGKTKPRLLPAGRAG